MSAELISNTNVHIALKISDSRVWGHEAKLRPHRDTEPDLVIIPDPTQTALNDGVIRSWQAFSYIVNVDYRVYFQVRIGLIYDSFIFNRLHTLFSKRKRGIPCKWL
jgi:hypothetical protein